MLFTGDVILHAFLITFVKGIDQLTESLGRAIAWLTLVVVVLTFLIVLLRYGFNIGWVAMQESVLYFHALVFMLGAGYTLKHDGHVRVDIFYQHFSQQQKAWINLLGTLLLLLPVCAFVFVISLDYVLMSWQIMESSKEPGGLAFVYLNKTMILLLVFSLVLQGGAEICRNILVLINNKEVK